jgi:hypothetical protein
MQFTALYRVMRRVSFLTPHTCFVRFVSQGINPAKQLYALALMNRKDLIFLGIAVSVVALFIVLSVIGRKPKPMSARPEHAGMSRDTAREDCLACHAPDSQVAPMPARHPKKGKPPDRTTPCYACHKLPEPRMAALVFRLSSNHLNRSGEVRFIWPNQQQQ